MRLAQLWVSSLPRDHTDPLAELTVKKDLPTCLSSCRSWENSQYCPTHTTASSSMLTHSFRSATKR